MSLYSILLDVILLIISLCFIYAAYKKGFICSIINMVGYVVAIVCAIFLSRILSDFIFQTFLRERIFTTISQQFNGSLSGIVNGKITNETDFSNIGKQISGKLPSFFSNGVDNILTNNQSLFENFIGKTITETSALITDKIIAPIIISFLKFIFCILIFVICMIIIKVILKMLNVIKIIPVVGGIDSFLGGAVGILQAFVFALIIAMTVKITVNLNSFSWLNDDIINNTFIFKLIYNIKFI